MTNRIIMQNGSRNPAVTQMRTLLLLASAAVALVVSGCGTATLNSKSAAPITVAAASSQGIVMGGQQPVANITLQLYTVGTSSYGSAASPLGASFQTVASGNFTFPSFTCPSSTSLVYLLGNGGTPIGGSTNPNLSLMAGLGPCGSLPSFINVNEITTVATVYALSGFTTGPTNIGAPTSNYLGISNAFAAINKVVNIGNGATSGPALPTGATLPITKINSLGNILQNCVNSAGGSASDTTDGQTNGTPCGKLFYLTKTGSTTPTDVVTATILLAKSPSVNVAKLDDLQSSSPAFAPSLSVNSPPTDWTIAINYIGGGLSTPQTVATDASGDIWVTNKANNSVTELANTGAAVSGSGGYTAGSLNVPYGIAIDQSGYVWVSNSGNSTLTKLAPSGTSGSVYSGNNLDTPHGVAIDGAGNVWVADSGSNFVSAFTNSGAILTGSPFSGGGITSPGSIAISPK